MLNTTSITLLRKLTTTQKAAPRGGYFSMSAKDGNGLLNHY